MRKGIRSSRRRLEKRKILGTEENEEIVKKKMEEKVKNNNITISKELKKVKSSRRI